jgi:hypothetical protein
MLQRFQDRVGTAGLIVAVVALVLALGGGAYAASGALTGKQKKEVEKIAKKYAGKPGAPGAAGAAGPAGAKGDAGATGAAGTGTEGKQGGEGKAGKNGANGKSVEAIEIPTSDATHCHAQGGAFYEVEESAEATEICNGKEGSPWVADGLPAGKTEMGTWGVGVTEAATVQVVPISFSVPLSEGSEVSEVRYVNNENNEEEEGVVVATPAEVCLGEAKNPSAPPGVLCLYQQGVNVNTQLVQHNLLGRAGVVLTFELKAAEGAKAHGSWAVTAP